VWGGQALSAEADPDSIAEVAEMYRSRGVGNRLGFGRRVALLIVDFQQQYTRTWRASSLDPVENTKLLLDAAHERGCPVYYTYMGYDPDNPVGGVFAMKAPTLLENLRGSWEAEIDPIIAPGTQDAVLEKRAPSSFFGTGLHERLQKLGIDTVVVCGTSLSGCVRATVVDGLSHNYRMMVPRDCVADPSAPSMATSLLEIDTKYGDVINLDEARMGILASEQVLAPP
jgi:maleamate amidohydrolase